MLHSVGFGGSEGGGGAAADWAGPHWDEHSLILQEVWGWSKLGLGRSR